MSIKNLLDAKIKTELQGLQHLEASSEEYRDTVNGIAKLMDWSIDLSKLDIEMENNVRDRENDNNIKLMEMKEERLNRLIQNSIAVAGIILPICLTVWGAKKSWKFEEEGTITTSMGRSFMSRLMPRK